VKKIKTHVASQLKGARINAAFSLAHRTWGEKGKEKKHTLEFQKENAKKSKPTNGLYLGGTKKRRTPRPT